MCCPPPIARVHIEIHTLCLVLVRIMALGREKELLGKFGGAEECLHTLERISHVNLKRFAFYINLVALEPGTHTLCLQAADGAHTALPGEGMTHTISITVP